MADRSLVLDANILLRAVIGRRVGKVIGRYAKEVGLFAPDTAFLEVEEYLAPLAAKAGMPLSLATAVYERVALLVQELPQPVYVEHEGAARARIDRVDPDDWPVVASALVLECPIWTEDRDFFGTGIPIWTTDRVELYLSGSDPRKSQQSRPQDSPPQ